MSKREQEEKQAQHPSSSTAYPADASRVDPKDLRLSPPSGSAAGWEALRQSMKHVWDEMGVVRGIKVLNQLNQKDGFDCPGCAWPDPAHRSAFEYCENGVKAVAEEATTKRVTPDFFKEWSVDALLHQTDHWLGKRGRLTHPMIKEVGATHYAPLSWDDAFARIAEALASLDDPNEAIFYTSGRTSNEAAFLYQLFVRKFGTNNLPDCSNMCHESSGRGLGDTIGIGKGTVQLEDFEKADAIFVIGQNPGTNHPRMLTALQQAARKGCEIVSINPLKEPGLIRFKHPQEAIQMFGKGTVLASLHLPVRINGDVALLKGIMKAMLETEQEAPGTIFDHDFIETYTQGFDAFQEALEATTWAEITASSGLTREEIQRAADVAMRSKRTIVCWAMGLTQHENGVANIQEVVNFLLLRGNLGREGAGACPVRGHSNVQGDRTMGIWEKPPSSFLNKLGAAFSFSPPQEHGHDTVHAIKAMYTGEASVFFAMGGNFLSATPDTEYTAEALRRTKLTVQVSTKLNRSHLVTGKTAIILPCLGRTERDLAEGKEQFVTVENSMGIVHPSRGRLEPASEELLSEAHIVARLATSLFGTDDQVPWLAMAKDYSQIRDKIAEVVPGFEDFNARIEQEGLFSLPNAVRERVFNTPSGFAHFTVHSIPQHKLASDQYMMMTIRSHDQYNTTIYGLDDRYRGVFGERRVILMHPDDIETAGFEERQFVDIHSHFRGEQRTAPRFLIVAHTLPRRCVATYFPEANVLVPIEQYAHKSHTPASKSVVVTLEATPHT